MQRTAKSKAEELFAASEKKAKKALDERAIERRKNAEHVAKLRALRLAKEAADKEAAAGDDAKKAAGKK